MTKFSNNLHKPDFAPIFGPFLEQKQIGFTKSSLITYLLQKALKE